MVLLENPAGYIYLAQCRQHIHCATFAVAKTDHHMLANPAQKLGVTKSREFELRRVLFVPVAGSVHGVDLQLSVDEELERQEQYRDSIETDTHLMLLIDGLVVGRPTPTCASC